MLDPIVSLSVALAEAPRTCAFLLGSGVSRDAGVPTGWEVMHEAQRQLHLLETDDQESDDAALDEWLHATGRHEMGYSEILELIAPDVAVRREYLAGMFEGIAPGAAHERLAGLAADGLASVFVTTNFDRLLEHALQARGIDPVVITCDADLVAAAPREHAGCWVIKPHGDYLQQTIRNTPEELAELEPGMTTQLTEVFDRYGIVVLGYSGSDPAISQALRTRSPRYGLWWVARGDLAAGGAAIVETVTGRVIRRDTAAEFLDDLRRRVATFEQHPTGQTPGAVHDSTLRLLREDDRVGLQEHLRAERNAFEAAVAAFVSAHATTQPTPETVRAGYEDLRPILDRRVASLFVLALHDEQLLGEEFQWLARGLGRRPLQSGYPLWPDIVEWACTWFGYVCGAIATRLERWEALPPILDARWFDRDQYEDDLVDLAGQAQGDLGTALAPAGNWIAPGWEMLVHSLDGADWILERYPELAADGEPRSSMAVFDLLRVVWHGLRQRTGGLAWFALGGDPVGRFAGRMHRDPRLAGALAAAIGTEDPADFLVGAADAVAAAGQIGHGRASDPAAISNIIRTGSWR